MTAMRATAWPVSSTSAMQPKSSAVHTRQITIVQRRTVAAAPRRRTSQSVATPPAIMPTQPPTQGMAPATASCARSMPRSFTR